MSYGSASNAPVSPVKILSARELLTIPSIRALCTSGFALSFICTSFDVVFVLFCYSPIQSGGLAFSVSTPFSFSTPFESDYILSPRKLASLLLLLVVSRQLSNSYLCLHSYGRSTMRECITSACLSGRFPLWVYQSLTLSPVMVAMKVRD